MEITSYEDKLKGSRAGLVYLVTADSNGQRAWFYIEAEKTKKELLLRAVKEPRFDLTKYGKVLYKGWGAEPPADVVAKLEEEYNQ